MVTTNQRDVTSHKGLQRMSTPSSKADGFISMDFARKANGCKISSQTLLFIVFSKVEKSEERNLIVRSYF